LWRAREGRPVKRRRAAPTRSTSDYRTYKTARSSPSSNREAAICPRLFRSDT
jgi:hypothetical protein